MYFHQLFGKLGSVNVFAGRILKLNKRPGDFAKNHESPSKNGKLERSGLKGRLTPKLIC